MRVISCMAIFVLLFCGEAAQADKPGPPDSYKELSADMKFVFVMLAPDPKQESDPKTAQAIRRLYAKSGLYRNDGSNVPLWTVDWYRDHVHVAADGIHLVRQGDWPSRGKPGKRGPWVSEEDLKQEGVSFFANGKLLRQYSIGELVDEPKLLKISVSHFRWLQEAKMIDARNQFEITTLDGNRILFDLANAKVLKKEKVENGKAKANQ